MKVTDAVWELRNLGVSTQEVEIVDNDSIETVKNQLKELDALYQVVKVVNCRPDYYSLLMGEGFSFVEALIRVSYNLKELTCPRHIKRFSDELTFDEMNDDEIALMMAQIRGGVFRTDRVTLDPFFSKEQAANRYVMWMKDEIERGSHLFNYKYKGEPISYTCMKVMDKGRVFPVLGALYNIGKPLPIGNVTVFKQLEIAQSLGGKELFTYISANNTAAVRVYSQLGYLFEDIKYVFVKHKKET